MYHGHTKYNGNFLFLILLNLSAEFGTDDQSPFLKTLVQLLPVTPQCPSFSFTICSHPNRSSSLIFLSDLYLRDCSRT